jgi:hypothetical protein
MAGIVRAATPRPCFSSLKVRAARASSRIKGPGHCPKKYPVSPGNSGRGGGTLLVGVTEEGEEPKELQYIHDCNAIALHRLTVFRK